MLPFVDKSFITASQCECLLSAFNQGAMARTSYEFFEGSLKYANDIEDQQCLKALDEVSEAAVNQVNAYYPQGRLYLESVMLVYWPTGKSMGTHVDNQVNNGDVVNATTWRDFSAIIYLNENFEGGELYFQNALNTVIKPETGMMVSFDSGPSFPHGVRQVRKGQRYTISLWFTKDKSRAYSLKPFLKGV